VDTTKPPSKQAVQKDKPTKEVEAESIAFVVSEHFGLDTSDYSFGYVGTWSTSRELPEPKASLQTIRDASRDIINEMESHLQELQQERQTEQWRCYIIPDLMTWARPGEKEETPIEYFDTFEEAADRFRELRHQSYNTEQALNEDTGLPYARLTFGIQRDDPPSSTDLLHVQDGKNVLVDDFTRMEAFKDNPIVFDTLSRLGSEIGFKQVLVHRSMTPEEIRDFTHDHLADRLQHSGLPENQQKEYLTSFDAGYREGQLDNLKPSPSQQIIVELQDFTDWPNPYFAVTDTPERLAADIDTFTFDFDPYEYNNNLDSSDSAYAEILTAISNGDTEAIQTWLSEIVDEESEYSRDAQKLLHRLETMVPTAEKEILSDILPEQPSSEISVMKPEEAAYQIGSRYLQMQVASDGSWDYSIYDRNLNLIDGGQIGDENISFFDARNDIIAEYGFPQNEPFTGIAPDRFAEMLDAHENNMKCPICPLTLMEAREQNRLEEWRICNNANETCARQFSKEYGMAYHEHRVPEFLSQMVDRYGMDRCKMVLAGTIQLAPWDGRYHQPVRTAAEQIQIPGASENHDRDTRLRYLVNCHPVMIDVAFRDLMAMEKEQNHEAEKPAPTKSTTKTKKEAVPEKKATTKRERTSVLKKLKSKQAELASAGSTAKAPNRDKPQL